MVSEENSHPLLSYPTSSHLLVSTKNSSLLCTLYSLSPLFLPIKEITTKKHNLITPFRAPLCQAPQKSASIQPIHLRSPLPLSALFPLKFKNLKTHQQTSKSLRARRSQTPMNRLSTSPSTPNVVTQVWRYPSVTVRFEAPPIASREADKHLFRK